MLIWLTLIVNASAFSLAEWTAKHGLTYHPEKLRWEKAWVILSFFSFIEKTKFLTLDKGSSNMHEGRRSFSYD